MIRSFVASAFGRRWSKNIFYSTYWPELLSPGRLVLAGLLQSATNLPRSAAETQNDESKLNRSQASLVVFLGVPGLRCTKLRKDYHKEKSKMLKCAATGKLADASVEMSSCVMQFTVLEDASGFINGALLSSAWFVWVDEVLLVVLPHGVRFDNCDAANTVCQN